MAKKIKAIIKLLNIDFGVDIISYNDIPPGRGLGSSASFATLLISMLLNLQNISYDQFKVAEIAFKAEREELKIGGGWQDQYSAISGGFNYMEFNKLKRLVYPLKIKKEVINELNERLMLCFVGVNHESKHMHLVQKTNFIKKEKEIAKLLNETKEIAIKIKDCLLTRNLEEMGELLHKSWLNKKRLSSSISNQKIDAIYELGLKSGALGGRLLGAGGGGYILFYVLPEKREKLKKELKKANLETVDFQFEENGLETWRINS